MTNGMTDNRPTGHAGLSALVDVFDQGELFELIDNDCVVRLSQMGSRPGFRDARSVHKSTGISQRRILRQGRHAEDLGLAVWQRLQSVTGRDAEDYSRILLCHSHVDPDACHRLAALMESAIGVSPGRIRAFNFGCTGFLKLLSEAVSELAQHDHPRPVAIVSVETPETWHDASDRLFCGIVSAGATAGVVEQGGGLPLSAVCSGDIYIPPTDRPNPRPLFSRDTATAVSFRGEPIDTTVMRMNPDAVFLNGIELMLSHLRMALNTLDGRTGGRIIVAPHQPSGKLLKALIAAARKEFPDVHILNNLDQYGNTISSSVPTLLSRLNEVMAANNFGPPQEGDFVLLLAAGICMDEIQDHMSAGYACLEYRAGALRTRPVARSAPAVQRPGEVVTTAPSVHPL